MKEAEYKGILGRFPNLEVIEISNVNFANKNNIINEEIKYKQPVILNCNSPYNRGIDSFFFQYESYYIDSPSSEKQKIVFVPYKNRVIRSDYMPKIDEKKTQEICSYDYFADKIGMKIRFKKQINPTIGKNQSYLNGLFRIRKKDKISTNRSDPYTLIYDPENKFENIKDCFLAIVDFNRIAMKNYNIGLKERDPTTQRMREILGSEVDEEYERIIGFVNSIDVNVFRESIDKLFGE